jgi:AraC-like DNA-binding protein
MADIPLTRCQFLLPFVGILDETGAPTSSLLTKFRLPSSLVDKSDLYVPLMPAIRFMETARRSQGIEEFGFLASQRLHFSHMREKTRALIAHSPTLLVALRHACTWAPREDTILSMWIEHDDDHARICTRLAGTNGSCIWSICNGSRTSSRYTSSGSSREPDWMPATIAFEARYTPRPATQSLWPNVRFLSGQHAAWIDVPISYLSLTNHRKDVSPAPQAYEDGPSGYDIVELLKLMLPSYLDDGIPALAEVAEMAGVSTRSFQRKLAHVGLSYSDLLDTVRYENASKLLRDSNSKIIDIAFSSGYTDPAHFSRAFRRISGVTPRQFREQSRLC